MRQQIRHQDIKLSRSERKKLIRQIKKEKERKKADRLRAVLYKNQGLTHQGIAELLQIRSMSHLEWEKMISCLYPKGHNNSRCFSAYFCHETHFF